MVLVRPTQLVHKCSVSVFFYPAICISSYYWVVVCRDKGEFHINKKNIEEKMVHPLHTQKDNKNC